MLEAIILAGGLGTRLRPVVEDLPKCMAPVAGRPFISYLLDYYLQKGVRSFILAVGYRHEAVEEYLRDRYPAGMIQFSVEATPLGTGGALKLACQKASGESALVLNGDTFFRIAPEAMMNFHASRKADCTIALKPMSEFDRYGAVQTGPDQQIAGFQEKKYYTEGLINGGVYLLKIPSFLGEELPEKFSFENDYLEVFYTRRPMYGLVQDRYFIDIGIPADYARAQTELPLNI